MTPLNFFLHFWEAATDRPIIFGRYEKLNFVAETDSQSEKPNGFYFLKICFYYPFLFVWSSKTKKKFESFHWNQLVV